MRLLPIIVIATMTLTCGSAATAANASSRCDDYYACQEGNLSESNSNTSELVGISDYEVNDYYYEENSYSPEYTNQDVADFSTLPRRISPHGERVFIFSPRLLRWAAYDSQGYRVASGVANGGADLCEDLGRPCRTPRGTYRIHTKKGADCISNTFPLPNGGAQMPFCMFFTGGYAIHGSPYISGSNTSHGCIRVHTGAARWLHRHFLHRGTKVVVLPY